MRKITFVAANARSKWRRRRRRRQNSFFDLQRFVIVAAAVAATPRAAVESVEFELKLVQTESSIEGLDDTHSSLYLNKHSHAHTLAHMMM